MINKVKEEFLNQKNYIYIGIALIVATLSPQFLFSPTLGHSIFILIIIILMVFILLVSKWGTGILLAYFNISNIIIGHIALHWGYGYADISPRIYAMALSPSYETIEYLKTYIDYRDVILVLYTITTLFAILVFLKNYNNKFHKVKLVGIIFIVLIGLGLNGKLDKEPLNILMKYISVYNKSDFNAILNRSNFLQSFDFDNYQKSNALYYKKIVIVIGESVNKHHMGIYQYDVNTTPFLSSLEENKKLYKFNAIAPANQTSLAVPILLTNANVNNFMDNYIKSLSLISYGEINGYLTKWLSNQGKVGRHENFISSIAGESNSTFFLNKGRYFTSTMDNLILEKLKNNSLEDSKEMSVIHLMGSHFEYKKRYDKKHSIYKDTINPVEEYDNTIYYTDYILSEIYKYYKSEDSLLFIYVSDHGEVVAKEKYGHGFTPAYKEEYDVPFIIYSSIQNDRLDSLYKKNTKHYFNMENFSNMVQYITGMENELNISYSSKVLTLDIKNIIDYDSLSLYEKKDL